MTFESGLITLIEEVPGFGVIAIVIPRDRHWREDGHVLRASNGRCWRLPFDQSRSRCIVLRQRASAAEPRCRGSVLRGASRRCTVVSTAFAALRAWPQPVRAGRAAGRGGADAAARWRHGEYFSAVSRSGAVVGRTFTSAEEDRTPGARAVAMISAGFWRRRFGRNRRLDHGARGHDQCRPHTIIGGSRAAGVSRREPTSGAFRAEPDVPDQRGARSPQRLRRRPHGLRGEPEARRQAGTGASRS